jgi:hypothetical protein
VRTKKTRSQQRPTSVSAKTLERIGVVEEKKDLEFVMANGQRITRSVGFAIIRIGKAFTVDEVVFAERGDLLLLGTRSLEGLNLTVDSRRKRLVAARCSPREHQKRRLVVSLKRPSRGRCINDDAHVAPSRQRQIGKCSVRAIAASLARNPQRWGAHAPQTPVK